MKTGETAMKAGASDSRHLLHAHPTLFALVYSALEKYPDRIAFQESAGSLTYAQARRLLGQIQKALSSLGLTVGARVALLSENRADVWIASVAAQGLGIATCWLHPKSSLTTQLDQITSLRIDAVIIDNTLSHRSCEIAARSPGLNVLSLGASDVGIDLLDICRADGDVDLMELAKPDDIGTLNFTGGTTGRQRSVIKTNSQIGQMAASIHHELRIPDAPRYLATAYISHVSGQMITPVLMHGGTVFLRQGFNVAEFLDCVEAHSISMALLVPTMIYRMLETPVEDRNLSSLKLVVYAGSVIAPAKLREAIERIGPVFSQIYAQSECTPISVMRQEDHDLQDGGALSTCGYPAKAVQVFIVNDAGEKLPRGEVGEICVRSPLIMEGYLDDKASSDETLAGGLLHTGDVGFIDRLGRLSIVDRKKDMIVSGGFNVYPREVEDVLASHPSVGAAAVIGVPDADWGEAVAAVVVLHDGAEASDADLISYVKQRKGSLLAPKIVLFAKDLPMTGFGKVDKKALRAPFWAGKDRAVG